MAGGFRFTGDWPTIAVVLVALIAACATAAYYRRETRSAVGAVRWLLPLLRGSAIAMALVTLSAPVWYRERVIGTLGKVTFAVDVSQSMSITDSSSASDQPSRASRAAELLIGSENRAGWVERLRETHELQIVAFSSGEPQVVWSSRGRTDMPQLDRLTATGPGTDLNSAVRMFQRDTMGATGTAGESPTGPLQNSALVLMTDGRDTVGGPAIEAAARLGGSDSRVHAVGMGSDQEPPDIGIVEVRHPGSVPADGQIVGELVLKHYGYSGSVVDVRVESSTSVVWRESVALEDEGLQVVPFQLEVAPLLEKRVESDSASVKRDAVVLDLTAVADVSPGEMSEANNRSEFRVAVSTRERRLLILDGSSRWETRYIRNLFQRDPRWRVEWLLVGPGTDRTSLKYGTGTGEFPDTQAAMARYDAIVIGELPPEALREEDIARLKEFVVRGGGLLIIDGRYERVRQLAETPLDDLIPVRHRHSSTSRTERAASSIDRLQPTPGAVDRPLFNLGGEAGEVSRLWRQLPAPSEVVAVEAKEGAEVWAEAVSMNERRFPWLVTQLFGSGRVVYLAGGETWRWRYKVGDRFHARFWNQLVASAIQPPYSVSDDYAAIGTDQIEYQVGDRATVRARLQDAQGRPIGDATVDAILLSDNRPVATMPLQIDDPARGTYRGQTVPLESGQYRVKLQASGFDVAALRATTPIWVEARDPQEFARVSLDRETLSQLAAASNGRYVHETDADSLLEEIVSLSGGKIIRTEYPVWQSFYWFAAILLLLTVEWLLRKRSGLV